MSVLLQLFGSPFLKTTFIFWGLMFGCAISGIAKYKAHAPRDKTLCTAEPDNFCAGGFASDELSSRKRSVAATGAVVASARRAMRALSEQHRRSFVRRLRDAAASDAFRERASRALAACFRGDEASEPSERATLGSLAVDPEASLEGVAAENSAVSVLQTSRLALALASPPDVVLDALYDAARADPASVERSKLASFARRLRDASERLRPSSAQTARHRNSSEAADDARGETSDLSNRKCRFDRRLSCCVAAELLTSAFESHGDAFEPRADSPDGGKDGSRKGTFFETFYGAFEEEERRALTRALHALRSVAAERSKTPRAASWSALYLSKTMASVTDPPPARFEKMPAPNVRRSSRFSPCPSTSSRFHPPPTPRLAAPASAP